MGLNSIGVRKNLRLWMSFIMFFDAAIGSVVGILVLLGTGLISAGIVMLLMNLGLPDED